MRACYILVVLLLVKSVLVTTLGTKHAMKSSGQSADGHFWHDPVQDPFHLLHVTVGADADMVETTLPLEPLQREPDESAQCSHLRLHDLPSGVKEIEPCRAQGNLPQNTFTYKKILRSFYTVLDKTSAKNATIEYDEVLTSSQETKDLRCAYRRAARGGLKSIDDTNTEQYLVNRRLEAWHNNVLLKLRATAKLESRHLLDIEPRDPGFLKPCGNLDDVELYATRREEAS